MGIGVLRIVNDEVEEGRGQAGTRRVAVQDLMFELIANSQELHRAGGIKRTLSASPRR